MTPYPRLVFLIVASALSRVMVFAAPIARQATSSLQSAPDAHPTHEVAVSPSGHIVVYPPFFRAYADEDDEAETI
ncbi:hypothetical protein FB451DRAFT_1405901 [Mycena latifolia]|nr:hypothetical protein FB451DRAFT_1405901 [Mycena latifolia]